MIIDRRQALVLAGAAAVVLALPTGFVGSAFAGDAISGSQPFTKAAFDAAQKAGKSILVDTYATWCQICARQAPIIDKLHDEAKYQDVIIFRVNFDTQKDVMREFHANVQSTLIAFRGNKEVGRSVGETQPEWVEDLFDKAVAARNSTT